MYDAIVTLSPLAVMVFYSAVMVYGNILIARSEGRTGPTRWLVNPPTVG